MNTQLNLANFSPQSLAFSLRPLLFCLLLPLCGTFCLSAQPQYSVDWYKIAGGGGSSSNGQYSLSGTVGQPDASGPMTGGQFSLTGGFWSLVEVMQTPGAPTLRVYNTNGLITLAWAKPAEGWLLQATNALPGVPSPWPQVPLPYLTNDADIYIITSAPPAHAFFRLFKP
jgi:hypothetical protein